MARAYRWGKLPRDWCHEPFIMTTGHINQARHKYVAEGTKVGFFTDPTVCIGCKACEVACKEWNDVPEDGLVWTGHSYDNSGSLGASTWRHVKFRELDRRLGPAADGPAADGIRNPFGWLFLSDVCKHCEHAGCLEACPTGAIFRTEVSSVYVQDDVCNGCGTCVAGCPFGVVERRGDGTAAPTTRQGERKGEQPEVPKRGVAQKCTLCYDRLVDDQTPACAKTCPTTSIKFGNHEDLLVEARARVEQLHAQGLTEARLYGANDLDGVGGTGSVFLLLDEPEVYGLPPDPRVCTADLMTMYKRAGIAAAGMVAAAAISFLRGKPR